MDDRLGSSQMFGMLWCKGAGMTAPSANSPNFYAALENMPLNNDKQPSMGRFKSGFMISLLLLYRRVSCKEWAIFHI